MPTAPRQLRILAANRLSDLAEALAEELRRAPLPPFQAETIIVQSPGMRRWLTLELARRLGCAAGLATPFPSRFCLELAERLGGHEPPVAVGDQRGDPFAREALAWRLFARLGQPLAGTTLAPLAAYLREGDQRSRWQLALRIADRFDAYQLYRGDLLLDWEAGRPGDAPPEHAAWQATLWRELVTTAGGDHLARHLDRAIRRLETATTAPSGLPPRVTAFAVGSVPPVFLALLRALARHVPVAIHLVSPTPHYWGDIRSAREQARERQRAGSHLAADIGNPLLANFGRQGRELAELLHASDDTGQAWEDLAYRDPGTGCALHALQHDVLELIDRGGDGGEEPLVLADDDDSLTIHACHSPLRELEVVRDQLLAAFAADPTLTPDQVLVLASDVERYAPFAAAVLGARRGGEALPVRLADRGREAEDPVARALLALLRLADGRLTAPEVCDLLEADPVRIGAGIGRDELSTLRAWIAATGIRWGADGDGRAALGLPAFAANTWRHGLDRLIAGAATGAVEHLAAGIAPWGGDTAGGADLAGRFARWFDRLAAALADLGRPRPLADWAGDLPRLVDAVFAADHEAVIALRARVAELLAAAAPPGGSAPVDLAVVRDHLVAELGVEAQAGAFLWGGITIAALRPLRTIPARVVAVCGLDDALFPHRVAPPAFDLIAARPRRGDRLARDEDRQLLLDTLLAAGDRLILTYVGRSQVDDAELPPSVCVAELLDWADRAFICADGTAPRRRLVTVHPLQPFSPRYRDGHDRRLFTYTPAAAGSPPGPFCAAPLPSPDGIATVEWTALAEAWANPSRHFCRNALDLRLDDGAGALDEHEPFALDGLAAFHLRTWLADGLRSGCAPAALEELAAARGVLPVGGLGRDAFAEACAEAALVVSRLGATAARPPLAVDLHGDGWRLGGLLDGRHESGLLHWRAGKVREQDLIQAWVAHLVAQVVDGGAVTRVVGLDRALAFQPVTEAADILADLMAGWREGLTRPLPLFPRAGHAYVEQARNPKARSDPLAKAQAAWAGGDFQRGACDRDDPYVACCFRGGDPLRERGEEFIALAHRLWEPLFDAMADAP